jgi:hypothetical protein
MEDFLVHPTLLELELTMQVVVEAEPLVSRLQMSYLLGLVLVAELAATYKRVVEETDPTLLETLLSQEPQLQVQQTLAVAVAVVAIIMDLLEECTQVLLEDLVS